MTAHTSTQYCAYQAAKFGTETCEKHVRLRLTQVGSSGTPTQPHLGRVSAAQALQRHPGGC